MKATPRPLPTRHEGPPVDPVSTMWWAVAGLVAGLSLTGVMLGLRLLTGVPSLPEILQDRLLALLPGRFVGLLIDHLQFWSKPLLLLGWVAGQTLVGTLLAVGFGRVVQSQPTPYARRRLVVAGLLCGLAFWASIELLLLPLLGQGLLGTGASQGGGSAALSLLAFVAYGLVLVGFRLVLGPLTSDTTERGPLTAPAGRGAAQLPRRRAIALALASGAASLSGLTLWRFIAQIGEHGTSPGAGAAAAPSPRLATGPAVPSTSGAATALARTAPATGFVAPAGISPALTPTRQFYVVSKNLVDPRLSASGWTLELTGLVETPLRLTYADLQALPAADLFLTLECISNPVAGEEISTTRWTGVPLADLLDRAGVRAGAAWVVFTSADQYREDLPLALARQPTTLLAHSMEGQPLPAAHGFPLRLVTTNRYGMKNPKWLRTIELAAQPITGYWEAEGWQADTGIQTMARFDTQPRTVHARTSVLLGGIAFSGDRGISRVEVSADTGSSGSTWAPAALSTPLSRFTWVRWSYRWLPAAPGHTILRVRVIDGQGAVQPAARHDSFPHGATGYHTLHVEIV